jgi:hypothetical protein
MWPALNTDYELAGADESVQKCSDRRAAKVAHEGVVASQPAVSIRAPIIGTGERNSKALDFSKSTRQANENGYGKPKGAYRWIVSADGMNGYATILIKRIGNYLKAFAVHFHALGRRETEISDFCTVLRRYRNRGCRRGNCKCFENIDARGNQAASFVAP